jgi:RHS repeat-associated protein
VINLSYATYDANGNITGITNTLEPTKNKSFTYDNLDRLATGVAAGLWGSLSWTYDGVGNRLTENTNSYTYTASTNRLATANGNSYTFDNNGNTTVEGAKQFIYNQNQRLIQANNGGITAYYTYNGNGQRVKKTVSGTATIFHYSLNGQIIAESDSTGTITAEYVYLNGNPLAKIEGTNTYYYHTDHLATPQKMTDGTQAVVWSADYKPFGEATITTSTITNNLRFPGQYYDAETGLNYNYYRDYNPVIGRYIEGDPLLLPFIYQGRSYFVPPFYTMSPNTLHEFIYTSDNPVVNSDPSGLMGNKGDDPNNHRRGNFCSEKLQQRINNGACPKWDDCFICCHEITPDVGAYGSAGVMVCTGFCAEGIAIAKKNSCKCKDVPN